jgi:hypothetical protein
MFIANQKSNSDLLNKQLYYICPKIGGFMRIVFFYIKLILL